MDPDMNHYDLEHATTAHPRMTPDQWREIYDRAWHLYYSPEHVETLLRRSKAGGAGSRHVRDAILMYYGSYRFEKVHPLQCGILRRKVRSTRRPGLPRENPLLFYPRRLWDVVTSWTSLAKYCVWIEGVRRRIDRDPRAALYTDAALSYTPPSTDAAGKAVAA